MIRQAIIKLSNKQNLTYDEASQVMNEMMSGETTQVQIAAFLTALAMKGETIEEITGCAAAMRAKGVRLLHNVEALEIVGTGGDQSNSFNISTTSAIVIAAGGVPVAKHGNRAASSKSGAADCLEALGVNIMITPGQSTKLLESIGICFLFAQNYHASMKYVAPVRKELGIRTVFNLLGPLSNPAGATMELMGVYDESLVEPLSRVMTNLGVKRGMVVYGQDKLDEISMSAPTTVCEINNGHYRSYVIQPEDFGLKRCTKDELAGAVVGYFANRFKENPPIMTVVEAKAADCLFRSASKGDGSRVDVTGDMLTIMAGLACGEPNTVSWDILRNHADAFVSCPDWVSANGTRIYSSPMRGDERVISGESGSVTMGLVAAIMTKPELKELKEALKLDENSQVLLVSSEGDTDPDRYREIVWEGLCGTDKEPFADLQEN